MLIALLTLLLLGSSGTLPMLATFNDARGSIKEHVADRDRREELVKVIDDAERTEKAALKGRKETIEKLSQRMRAYEGKAAEIQPLLQQMVAEADAAQDLLVRTRFALKEKMSREEWGKVFPAAPSR